MYEQTTPIIFTKVCNKPYNIQNNILKKKSLNKNVTKKNSTLKQIYN